VKPEPAAAVAAEPVSVLRSLREGDAQAIARWYDKAIVLAGSFAPLSDLFDSTGCGQTLVLVEEGADEPVGAMVVIVHDSEPGWATVNLLAVADQEQRDLAAQAVGVLETRLRGEAGHIRAAVPLDVGLALYFWLRLGYRPTVSGEGLWVVRDLDA
jgi:hypothetical protein